MRIKYFAAGFKGTALTIFIILLHHNYLIAQIGTRFPSERKVTKDPVTGTELIFLTSEPVGDSKIYQTHPQWTSDGNWIVFRSNRVKGEAMAVHEYTGEIVQVTEGGYTGMLNLSRKSMKLYILRRAETESGRSRNHTNHIIEIDLEKLFTDSRSGRLMKAVHYERLCGTIPAEIAAVGDMALDADEEWAYFRIGREEAARHLPEGTIIEENFGPRNMGAGPSGIGSINLLTGEYRHVVSVPFQVGHIQTNPWVPGEIVFCWETGGKAPQRTWTVRSDGTALRPLYPETEYEWVTHEAIITEDEVAIAIMGHRKVDISETGTGAKQLSESARENPGQETEWGPSGTREKPTGMGIVNLRTREMMIIGQADSGSGLWHVHGSADGRWAVGDDFSRSIYLIDRKSREMIMISTGHKTTAADHPHPSFSPCGTKIHIQSAMLSDDGRTMNICIIPVPEGWLNR